MGAQYIILDTETTGIEPVADDIIEIAMIRDDGHHVGGLHGLRLRSEIPAEAKAVHHITEAQIADLPPLDEGDISGYLCDMAHDHRTYLVAHNAAFDRGMLEAIQPDIVTALWICTWRCAMHIWPDAPRHSNQVLRYALGLEPPVSELGEYVPTSDGGSIFVPLAPHRALYDIVVTKAILERMLETHTLEQLHELSTKPVLLSTVRFGKHRGQRWAEVPRSYLEWCLKQTDMDADVRHTAMHWLRGPGRLL